jgi:hypothetical protein
MMKKSLHIFIQKNTGVGKSLSCSCFAQTAVIEGKNVKCFDLDEKFNTLAKYEICETEQFGITASSLDHIFNELVSEEEAVYVIDMNAVDYDKLNSHLTGGALDKLQKEGVGVYIHSVVVGGKKLMQSLDDLTKLMDIYSHSDFIIWTNNYFGDVVLAGKDFKGMKVYEKYENVIKSVISLERPTEYMERDIKDMIKQNITYSIINTLDIPEAKRNRMIRFYDHVFTQIKKDIFGGVKLR